MALGRRTCVLICNLRGRLVGRFFVSVTVFWAVLCANHDTSTHEKYGVELWRHSGGYVAVSVACRVSVVYVAGVVFKRGLSDIN